MPQNNQTMTKRITLDLTHRQFELLLQLVYMGDYCRIVVPRPAEMTAEQGEVEHLKNKIYALAAKTEGLKHLADDYPDGHMRASIEVENRNEEILNEALDRLIIERLSSHFASEEVERVYGPVSYDDPEEHKKWSRIYTTVKDAMVKEMTKNEFKNIRLHLP